LVGEQPDVREPYGAYLEAIGAIGGDAAIGEEGAGCAPLRDLIAPFLGHPVLRTQYAADRAMYQLTGEAIYGDRLVEALRGDDLQLRRAALTDVGAIGYLPAAGAIAQTLAENSLKLIALKGLLEKQVTGFDSAGFDSAQPTGLSEGAIRVMDLMDGLL
jgi:phycocyanobilin lyase subunit alpha